MTITRNTYIQRLSKSLLFLKVFVAQPVNVVELFNVQSEFLDWKNTYLQSILRPIKFLQYQSPLLFLFPFLCPFLFPSLFSRRLCLLPFLLLHPCLCRPFFFFLL